MKKKTTAKKKKPLKLKKVSKDYTEGFINGIKQGERIGLNLAIEILSLSTVNMTENTLNLTSDKMKK